jgi:prepilin-type processing-associated H-X9-DG protein
MNRRLRAGFTLTEFVALVAIILLLVGLLVPVFRSARGKTRRWRCMNNLRSFAHVCLLYAEENRGKLPPGNRRLSANADEHLAWVNAKLPVILAVYSLSKAQLSCISLHGTDFSDTKVGVVSTVEPCLPPGPCAGAVLGWTYFGDRGEWQDPANTCSNKLDYPYYYPIVDSHGAPSGACYQMGHTLRELPTSRTLATCRAVPSAHRWGGMLSHATADDGVLYTDATITPFSVPGWWAGMNVAFMDGSVRWLRSSELSAIKNADDWYYYAP